MIRFSVCGAASYALGELLRLMVNHPETQVAHLADSFAAGRKIQDEHPALVGFYDQEILPLDDATMPFWSNGYLYVASSIFTGQVNKSLGVAYLPSNVSNPNLCILYTGNNRSLMFDLSGNFARDSDGNISFRGAIRRGGEIFVPASVVAEFFKLEYSVTPLSIDTAGESSYGALVWLRQPNFGLSEKDFINAAFSQISMRYEQYLRERQPEDSGAETPPIRNASRFSMRYSISSTPFMVIVKRRGEKDFTAAPGSRAAEGGMPWTAWKARLKAVGDW